MKEEQRLGVIKEVNKLKEELDDFEKLARELSYLSNADPQVRKYLELSQKVETTRKKLLPYLVSTSGYNEITSELIYKKIEEQVTNNYFSINEEQRCDHPIWLTWLLGDKTYQCLECGKRLKVDDSKGFEEKHVVLKFDDTSQFYVCRQLYYQYLYEYPTEEVVQKLIRKFKK